MNETVKVDDTTGWIKCVWRKYVLLNLLLCIGLLHSHIYYLCFPNGKWHNRSCW